MNWFYWVKQTHHDEKMTLILFGTTNVFVDEGFIVFIDSIYFSFLSTKKKKQNKTKCPKKLP